MPNVNLNLYGLLLIDLICAVRKANNITSIVKALEETKKGQFVYHCLQICKVKYFLKYTTLTFIGVSSGAKHGKFKIKILYKLKQRYACQIMVKAKSCD